MSKYESVAVFSVKESEEKAKALVEKFKALIEANGTMEAVDEWGLRKLAYEDLRAAMILGLEMGLEEIRAEGREPHENSVRALEWFRREVQA